MGSFDLGTGLLDGFIRYRGYSHDPYSSLEDFSDRLSQFVSSVIILVLVGVTTTNVYFLRPISCTLPTAPDGHFTVFAESVCWLQGTIGLNVDDTIPNEPADWDELRERSDIYGIEVGALLSTKMSCDVGDCSYVGEGGGTSRPAHKSENQQFGGYTTTHNLQHTLEKLAILSIFRELPF
ncbi:hypothetical protein SprV_0301054800 [Sparganum proliferum]